MNKRLALMPTADFASQRLQLHPPIGCVQPYTIYSTASRVDRGQAAPDVGSEVDASLSRLLSI